MTTLGMNDDSDISWSLTMTMISMMDKTNLFLAAYNDDGKLNQHYLMHLFRVMWDISPRC
jgi:hypothetical protein